MNRLGKPARAYLAANLLLGGIVLWNAIAVWQPVMFGRTAVYLVFAVFASTFKVLLPGVPSTMSANYILILAGVSTLDFANAIAVSTACTLTQCLWKPKIRPGLVQVAFNVASTATATALSFSAYHAGNFTTSIRTVPVRLFFACLTYYAVNTVTVAGIVAMTSERRIWHAWRDNYVWTAPQYLVGALIAGIVKCCGDYVGWGWSLLLVPTVYLIYRSYRVYLGRVEQERKHVLEIADLHLRTIETLAVAIEAKDEATHDHLRRVQVYATEIAKELRVGEEEQKALQAAALLHDIGKLAVPEYILSKPGKLTAEEFEKVKIHPLVGAEILERVNFPYPVVPIVAAHHEKWDGSGYPHGLKGDEIPIGARILSVVDCLDALASDRQYRRGLPLEEAMGVIVSQSGTSFDPAVISVLSRRYIELEERAKASPVSNHRLCKPAKVERGIAPGAGFERSRPRRRDSKSAAPGFTQSIAAARQEFQSIHELTSELGSSLSLEDTLTLLASRLRTVVPHDAIAIYVRDQDVLQPQYVNGTDAPLFSSLSIPVGQGLSGWVAENRKAIVNGNPSVEPGYLNDPSRFSVLQSALSIPLIAPRGTVGVLTLYHRDKDAFTTDHLRLMMAISSKTALTIENALEFRDVKQSATTDSLTGLPNSRSLFLHLDTELARCRRTKGALAVMVLDLDGFKTVNDRFGHLTGNRLLQRVATALKDGCREYDYTARMGGDEFVVLLPGIAPGDLAAKAEQLRSDIESAGRLTTSEDIIGVSIGWATYPEHGSSAEDLLAEADKNMYSVKQTHHRQRYAMFSLLSQAATLR